MKTVTPPNVQGSVVLTLKFQKEGRLWTGECLELGTATDGRSLEKVHDELMRLLTLDGWTRGNENTQVVAFRKSFPDGITRTTVIPKKKRPLASGTLGAILGPKQTGLGRRGLVELIERHGLT